MRWGVRRFTSVTDALGPVTDYAYDALDRLVQVTYPAAALGAVRQTTQSVYNALGQLAQSIDSYGAVTTYTYNANGQVAQITYPDPDGTGTQQSASVTYTYKRVGGGIGQSQFHDVRCMGAHGDGNGRGGCDAGVHVRQHGPGVADSSSE